MINNDFPLNNSGASNAYQTREFARHRWYFYKEGFSPSLVEKAIEENDLKSTDLVLDPFNGSGTVTLTSAMNGINSIGFEVNPFTSFLAKTKALNASSRSFQNTVDKTISGSLRGENSFLDNYSTFTQNEEKGNEKWLFNKEVLRSYFGGLSRLNERNSRSNSLVKLALISAAMKNCNAKKDGKCLRYKNGWNKKEYGAYSFLSSFESEANKILEDLDIIVENKPKIVTGDSRILIDKLDEKFKLCITSPPYLNTFDYTDIYRPELFLGGFVNSSEELRKLRYKTVRSHIQVNWKKPNNVDFGFHFNDVFKKILDKPESLMHKRIPEMIVAYFEDMKSILESLKRKAAEGASLWFVVSTSAYANEHVPVDLILADIATQVGWRLKEIGVLREIQKRKTKYSPNITKLRESVIILKV